VRSRTEIHSFVDPEFRDTRFNHLMVTMQLPNLDQRSAAETTFAGTLTYGSLSSVRSLDVVPPTRKLDDDRFTTALADAGVDGVLIVRLTDYYEEQAYIPETTMTNMSGNLSANTYYYGNLASTTGQVDTTTYSTTTGGYAIGMPRMRHEVQLWDVESGKMAWIAGTHTEGVWSRRFEDLMAGLAEKVRETLVEEGLLAAPAKGA